MKNFLPCSFVGKKQYNNIGYLQEFLFDRWEGDRR